MLRWIFRLLVLAVLAGAGYGAWWWYYNRPQTQTSSYRTYALKRGELVATISATGTIEPEELVDVGAQVAGQINTLGKDAAGKSIDYGSVVDEGMVLANIDDSMYTADVAVAKAQLAQAEASVVRAEADVALSKSKLDQAQRDWDRAKKLGPSDALSQSTYDGYLSAWEIATASIPLSDASVAQARGAVQQAQATLDRATRNLTYCTIKSPVKGVIIDRRVNIGQTVVASLNAPSLFLIAKDLHRLQVWVAVNEMDIGNIRPGQPVTFTVDAFPNTTFRGEVNKVRLNAIMTQNVVTYTVEVNTDNSDGRLLPYLTANLSFEVSRKEDVLLVPNGAFRWVPQAAQIAPDARVAYVANTMRRGGPDASGGRGGRGSTTRSSTRPSRGGGSDIKPATLWVLDGTFVRPVNVGAGGTDGSMTEVRTRDLKEGDTIVIGEDRRTTDAAAGTTNPFAPQMFRGRPGGGGGGAGGQGAGGAGAAGGTGGAEGGGGRGSRQ